MLIAQNLPRVRGDAFDAISCLTAVNLDGKILWQSGRPEPRNGLLTNDTPFQIHDIDGDGRNEVVTGSRFQLQVLDGRDRQSAAWTVLMPKAPPRRSGPTTWSAATPSRFSICSEISGVTRSYRSKTATGTSGYLTTSLNSSGKAVSRPGTTRTRLK